ncbi:MAG: protein-tyrosine-phosphatase [Cytophagales bacterium]|nr:protein-tyrosine-phosphatase [Cytophagales bacterium]
MSKEEKISEITLYPKLLEAVSLASKLPVSEERKEVLKPLIEYIQDKINKVKEVNLNFICTHNSRRSQLAQIWAKTAADYYGIAINSFSGGVEVTAFNERAVKEIKNSGFRVSTKGSSNPVYFVFNSEHAEPLSAFSKLYDDPINASGSFAAVMTCSHADENCPFIPGTEKRIAVRYEDPKEFDNTDQEEEKYRERSLQIASEMLYTFSNIQHK